jgi:hypothetical protein
MKPGDLHAIARGATVLLLLSAAFTLFAPPAYAANEVSLGRRYDDGLDTRLSALHLRDAAASIGYTAGASTIGRTANDAWSDGLNSAVFGLFGHANGGVFQVDEGPTDLEDPWLFAGRSTDVLPLTPNMRSFSEYLPFADVDDMRLLILAGCDTAQQSGYGDFAAVAEAKGIDAVVVFPELVYYPSTTPGAAIGTTDYAGNYFWGRFAYHATTGADVRTSLARARTDLVTKEGAASGWDLFVVEGAVANPGAVRLTPADNGQLLDSDPAATTAYSSFSNLSVTDLAVTEGVAGEQLTTAQTAEGVTVRRHTDGTVLDAVGVPSRQGAVTLSLEASRSLAATFVSTQAGASATAWQLVDERTATHGGGETLAAFTWRPTVGSVAAGPGRIDVEIDRRTGAVVYYAASRPTSEPDVVEPRLTQAEALAVVAEFASTAGADVDAELASWDRPTWTVTVDRGHDGAVPDVDRFVLDAVTGLVTARLTS